MVGQRLENIDKKLRILREYFGSAVRPEDFRAFMQARTPAEIQDAIARMIGEGLKRVEISKEPLSGDIDAISRNMIDLKKIGDEVDGG